MKSILLAGVTAAVISMNSISAFAVGAYDFSAHTQNGPMAAGTDNTSQDKEAQSAIIAYTDNSGEAGDTQIDASLQKVLDLVNAERAKNNLTALSWSTHAADAAQKRAAEAAVYFEHDRPDGRKFYSVYDDISAPKYRAVGENLAIGYSSADEVVAAWMTSPGHRANILNGAFQMLGVGSIDTRRGKVWVQEFYTAM